MSTSLGAALGDSSRARKIVSAQCCEPPNTARSSRLTDVMTRHCVARRQGSVFTASGYVRDRLRRVEAIRRAPPRIATAEKPRQCRVTSVSRRA